MFGLLKKKKEEKTIENGIITSPISPTPELQSEAGVRSYTSKLTKLAPSDICVELSCVMAAKYNIMSGQAGPSEYAKRQEIVSDLTDKALVICISQFGQPAVFGYAGNDLRSFNELVNKIDDEVAQLDLSPDQHGEMMLRKLGEYL